MDKQELYFDIIASLLSHLNFITINDEEYLQLKESRLQRLRDFSRTTRTGELAQGISYLFTQEKLDYPFVVDYHLFCELFTIVIPDGSKTPDFVVLKSDFSQIGLMESKGEASKTSNITGTSGKLGTAMNQLESVDNPCASELIPICTRFENDGNTLNSAIHYALVSNECDQDEKLRRRVLRQHYSSWFYLIGDFTRATQLLLEEGFTALEDDVNYVLEVDDNKTEVYWVERPFGFEFLNDGTYSRFFIHVDMPARQEVKFGIYKTVVDRILNNSIESKIEFPEETTDNYNRFLDGTVIRIPRRN